MGSAYSLLVLTALHFGSCPLLAEVKLKDPMIKRCRGASGGGSAKAKSADVSDNLLGVIALCTYLRESQLGPG